MQSLLLTRKLAGSLCSRWQVAQRCVGPSCVSARCSGDDVIVNRLVAALARCRPARARTAARGRYRSDRRPPADAPDCSGPLFQNSSPGIQAGDCLLGVMHDDHAHRQAPRRRQHDQRPAATPRALRQPGLRQVGAERALELARVDVLVRPQLDRERRSRRGGCAIVSWWPAELDDVADARAWPSCAPRR